MFESFELAKVGIPGRDGEHLYQFLPIEGVYMIEGSYLVEVQEIIGDGVAKKVIILSMLDSEQPIKAYIVMKPRYEDTLYFDATSLRVYIGFKKGKKQRTFKKNKDGSKKIIHEEMKVKETGIEAQQFDLSLIHKAAHRLE